MPRHNRKRKAYRHGDATFNIKKNPEKAHKLAIKLQTYSDQALLNIAIDLATTRKYLNPIMAQELCNELIKKDPSISNEIKKKAIALNSMCSKLQQPATHINYDEAGDFKNNLKIVINDYSDQKWQSTLAALADAGFPIALYYVRLNKFELDWKVNTDIFMRFLKAEYLLYKNKAEYLLYKDPEEYVKKAQRIVQKYKNNPNKIYIPENKLRITAFLLAVKEGKDYPIYTNDILNCYRQLNLSLEKLKQYEVELLTSIDWKLPR